MMRWKKIGLYVAAGVVASGLISHAYLNQLMEAAKQPFKDRIEAHVVALESYVEHDRLDSHDAFTKWIDRGADKNRALRLIDGLWNMYHAADGYTYGLDCRDGGNLEHYAWVFKSGYPRISFCNLFVYHIEGHEIFWLAHEGSHFYAPHGMGTNDEVGPSGGPYSESDAFHFARVNPEKAMSNAYSIENFISETPPPPLNPAITDIIPVLYLLLLE